MDVGIRIDRAGGGSGVYVEAIAINDKGACEGGERRKGNEIINKIHDMVGLHCHMSPSKPSDYQ